ncbi:hypothetical protein J2X31_003673 [Flavobacterium arsenatis]|uniref:Restriction endonuclease n=1 Tax=Flavobacterium arsenatis TaxID=1484332 RepID=A0ABU1TUV6_9FLAO|nr:hypothetical protein [Flavobacterium arsenatis]MDR6969640.1 hypothetical protein [Flavobacterium arsenatis]
MKLTKEDNHYHLTSKKRFEGSLIGLEIIQKSFDFAYEMAYGEGFHRNCRSGGQSARTKSEIFQNTFQGKIAEIVLYENLKANVIETEEPDFSIHGKGTWDDTDLKANGKSVCIKSAAFFSNLLLLETKDWDNEGRYIPNISNENATDAYDYFVLARINPDIKSLLKDIPEEKSQLMKKIREQDWLCDIPGCCSIKTLKHIISLGHILPQNAMLNGKTKMDAENYYIQSGDLFPIEKLYTVLKEK